MSDVAKRCRELLRDNGVEIRSEIDFEVNKELYTLSFEYIVDAYMVASDESQLVFLAALQNALRSREGGVRTFFEQMGQLLLMTHLSNKISL